MSEVTIIGIDLAKRIFHLHLAGHDGFVVFRKRLSRGQLPAFMSQVPQCVVAMETCATAHSWEQVWEQGSRVYNYFIIFKGQLGLCGGGGGMLRSYARDPLFPCVLKVCYHLRMW